MSTPQPSFVTPPVRGRGRSPFALLGQALRRPGGRRSLSVLSLVLLLAGVGLLAYPLATNVYQKHLQAGISETFNHDPSVSTQYIKRTIHVGDGVTELVIPDIDVDAYVVEGTTTAALRAGAGHYLGTALPGEPGNVGIAGHRTTFGHYFNRLDELHPGSIATLRTPFATYTYQAVAAKDFGGANPHPVQPTDTTVLDADSDPAASRLTRQWLTLTTCNPKGSAAQRLILRLALVKAVALKGKILPAGTQLGATAPLPKGGVSYAGGLADGGNG